MGKNDEEGLQQDEKPYNPLETSHIAIQLGLALMQKKEKMMPPAEFKGAGVYAIFYLGKNSLYKKLADVNREYGCKLPIYVGKAVKPGARKGILENVDDSNNKALFSRLSDHVQSIIAAEDLNIEDFRCKYLVIEDIWIPLAESIMINQYKPVWNALIDGFGNHNPGAGRISGKRSPWDTLHPGRAWANVLSPGSNTREELAEKVKEYLEATVVWPPFDFDD